MLRIHKKNIKDMRVRGRFLTKECEILLLKSLLHNRFLEEESKVNTYLVRLKLGVSQVKIRNRCVLTGRSRGVIRDFKLSRMCVKRMGNAGKLIGVKRCSW